MGSEKETTYFPTTNITTHINNTHTKHTQTLLSNNHIELYFGNVQNNYNLDKTQQQQTTSDSQNLYRQRFITNKV